MSFTAVTIRGSMVGNQRWLVSEILVGVLILGFVSTAYSDKQDTSRDSFIGTWLRQGTYINGALAHTTPATMVLNKDSFYSTGTCSTSGSLSYKGGTMTMIMTQSSCPGGLVLPYTVTFTCQISDKGERMTLQVANVMEKYLRKAEEDKQPQKRTVNPEPESKPDTGNANDPMGKHAKPSQNKILVN